MVCNDLLLISTYGCVITYPLYLHMVLVKIYPDISDYKISCYHIYKYDTHHKNHFNYTPTEKYNEVCAYLQAFSDDLRPNY